MVDGPGSKLLWNPRFICRKFGRGSSILVRRMAPPFDLIPLCRWLNILCWLNDSSRPLFVDGMAIRLRLLMMTILAGLLVPARLALHLSKARLSGVCCSISHIR
jgi:hypothetical protein